MDKFIIYADPTILSASGKILLATFLGGFVGYVRGRYGKPAGIKTHALVCVGACMVTLVSSLSALRHGGDPMRLPAQVISGIGFVGAGTILVNHGKITGLTTAAALWFAGCLGILIGSDYTILVIPAILSYLTIIFFFVHFDKPVEEGGHVSSDSPHKQE